MFPSHNPKRALNMLLAGLALISLALSACNLPAATPTVNDPNLIYTAAAQTVSAQLTQAAILQPSTPTAPAGGPATATQPVVVPTNTPPAQTQPTEPAQTPVPPTSTSVAIPCDRAEFVKDVTIPDDSEMAPGTEFVKTWRLRNNGSCSWNSSYSLVFHDKNALGGPAVVQLTTKTVEPGQTIDVSVTLKAPNAPGNYESDWILRNGSNVIFGIGAKADKFFWVKIRVTNTVNYNFYAKAKDAEWRNGSDEIDFGDKNDDSPGVAAYVDNAKLEDGKTYSKALATYPERIDNGKVLGIFSAYTVKDGDHFVAQVGFRSDCGNGKVTFQFGYMEGGSFQILDEWSKSCDGKMRTLNVNLADLEGEEHEFVLAIDAAGSFRNDRVMWIDPRIQKQ